MSRHGMKGPHGGMRGGAKAKDFKGSLKKLVKYMSVYKVPRHRFSPPVPLFLH